MPRRSADTVIQARLLILQSKRLMLGPFSAVWRSKA